MNLVVFLLWMPWLLSSIQVMGAGEFDWLQHFRVLDAFYIMQYYPLWAWAILASSILVIWALTAHGDEAL